MTLYSQSDSNIRKTWVLFFVFLVLIIGLGFLFSRIYNSSGILYFAVLFSVGASFFSYWYSDKIVFALTKAKPIQEQDNRELFHLVENLCIASGLPMPKIYIMQESQPNAFATGRNAKNSSITVSIGLLSKLEKVELEGVIAHELSHVKNRDTLLQTVIVVLVGIVALLSNFFFRIERFSQSDNDDTRVGGLLLLFGLAAAIFAPLAATLLQLAISRKREFLADASGALLTRYPEGLALALEKISSDPTPMRSASNSTAHLFIASPFKGRQAVGFFAKLFLTHPPVGERVSALRGMKV